MDEVVVNDINKMPPKCQYCPYWEVCKYPWVCPDIGDKKPETHDKRTESHACDLNSRAEAIDYFVTNVGFHDEDGYPIDDSDELRKIWTEYFDGIPSAQPSSSCGHEKDAQSVRKRGKWIHYEGYLICSECRTEYDDDIMTHCCDDVPKFCPNCGADMRGKQDDEP